MPKRKHRRRGVEEVRTLLAQARESGLSHRELAEQISVHPNTVTRWVRREHARDGMTLETTQSCREASFVPVRVVGPEVVTSEGDGRITVTLEGGFASRDVRLDLPRGVDPDDLRKLFGALAQHSC